MSATVIQFRPRRTLDPGGFRYVRAPSDPITLWLAIGLGFAALGAGLFFTALGRMGG